MKTFMLGWEFPPFISGGLGTACYGLTKAMDRLGIKITFVLPKTSSTPYAGHLKMLSAHHFSETGLVKDFENVIFRTIPSSLRPYMTAGKPGKQSLSCLSRHNGVSVRYDFSSEQSTQPDNYSGDMYSQVYSYADKVTRIASYEEFDVIHAHDWMTYPAGMAVAKMTGKPLLVHVHSTEFDRSGDNVNQIICDIEREGVHQAAKVISVSNYTKNIVASRYGVPADKIQVVHNGVENHSSSCCAPSEESLPKTEKVVLFLGRITMQKGPEYFIVAAKKVLDVIKNVKFVVAGSGDMMPRMVELAARLGIGHKVLFSGFLNGNDVHRAYRMADLYVMPSVSEPFGIAPLEAMQHKVPVMVSRQSGIAEVLTHALKVDFWDVDEMANKIVAVLKYPALHRTLCDNGYFELCKFRWEEAAKKVENVYREALTCA